MRVLTSTTAVALLLAADAAAHALVDPAWLERGRRTPITVTVANEHGSRLREVVVDAGGVRVQRPADALPGESVTLAIVIPPQRGDALAVRVEQRFADGTSESEVLRLAVRDREPSALTRPAVAAGAAGLLALLLVLGALARRRSKLSES